MVYTVHFNWDSDADVWIATSEDIPGLVLESGSFDALLERVRYTAPQLIDSAEENRIRIIAEREFDMFQE